MWMDLGFRVAGLVGTRRGGDSCGSCERELRGAGLVGARRGGDSHGSCERESRGAYLGCGGQISG
jgi:hypothetical protein